MFWDFCGAEEEEAIVEVGVEGLFLKVREIAGFTCRKLENVGKSQNGEDEGFIKGLTPKGFFVKSSSFCQVVPRNGFVSGTRGHSWLDSRTNSWRGVRCPVTYEV